MAYTITLGTSITSTRVTATVTDSTTFTSPIRSAVRVFLTGNKQAVGNTIDYALTLTANSSDPATVSSWSWAYEDFDGWVNFFYVIIKDAYDSGTTYNQYDAVYDGSNVVYRSLIASNLGNSLSDTTSWEVITDPSSLAANKEEYNESLNIESIVYQRILTYAAQYNYGNFVSEASEDCCGDCADPESFATYDLLSLLVNGAIQADLRTSLPEGETICRRLESIFETC